MEDNKLVTYIGTKQIQARPMTRGDHSISKGFGKVITGSKEDEGYKVIYSDGYESWSPKDTFEESYKIAETFKDRLIIERNELQSKLHKLSDALLNNRVPEVAKEDLKVQLKVMNDYLHVLNVRLTKI